VNYDNPHYAATAVINAIRVACCHFGSLPATRIGWTFAPTDRYKNW
jgi:hypothetical protein